MKPMADPRRPVRNVVLRDVIIERMALGALVVSGTLWPSGAPFAATMHALAGAPSKHGIVQTVFTDRGIFLTEHDCYSIGACFR